MQKFTIPRHKLSISMDICSCFKHKLDHNLLDDPQWWCHSWGSCRVILKSLFPHTARCHVANNTQRWEAAFGCFFRFVVAQKMTSYHFSVIPCSWWHHVFTLIPQVMWQWSALSLVNSSLCRVSCFHDNWHRARWTNIYVLVFFFSMFVDELNCLWTKLQCCQLSWEKKSSCSFKNKLKISPKL